MKGGLKIAKYVDVKITLEKTIKVNTNDLSDALKTAENEYPDLELTPEWLDARNVTIKENPLIIPSAERLASLCYSNFNKDYINEVLDMLFGKSEIRDYIYEETLDILRNKYHVYISKVDI